MKGDIDGSLKADIRLAGCAVVDSSQLRRVKEELKDRIIKSIEVAGASYPPAVMKHLTRIIRRVR